MENLEIKILDPDDKRLKQICTEVTDFSNPKYREMINKMVEICIENKAYGSAAPQFGITERFILMITVEEMKVDSLKELEDKKLNYSIMPYFNPRITFMEGKQYYCEACMSVKNTTGRVARPYRIGIEAQDINGNYIRKVVEGFEAIIHCHEIDHLDGIEFVDKSEILFENVDLEDRIKIRQEYPSVVISKTGEFDQSNLTANVRTLKYSKTE